MNNDAHPLTFDRDANDAVEQLVKILPLDPVTKQSVAPLIERVIRKMMNCVVQQMKDPAKFAEQTADQKCAGFCSHCGQPCEVGRWEVEDTSFDHAFGTEHQYSATPLSSCCEEEIMDDAALTIPSTLEYEPGDDEPCDTGD